ncbi:unnamed protein product, partial [Ceratitis capitata]
SSGSAALVGMQHSSRKLANKRGKHAGQTDKRTNAQTDKRTNIQQTTKKCVNEILYRATNIQEPTNEAAVL